MSELSCYSIFEVFGIEVEYMLTSIGNCDISSEACLLIGEDNRGRTLESKEIAWSNELVSHVVEFKNATPSMSLVDTLEGLSLAITRANETLGAHDVQLTPTAVHPFMDPSQAVLWPHAQNEIYQCYDTIFGCKGHGWSNLQSCHLNLPFRTEEDFRELHSAIRLLLPFIPALAASSPFLDGCFTGLMDSRLEMYRRNQIKIPEIAGKIVPEHVDSIAEYHAKILEPMYIAIAPFDPTGILRQEWLNSRGAIAKFWCGAIEIRVTDLQETVLADCAIAALLISSLKWMIDSSISPLSRNIETDQLANIFWECARAGSAALIESPEILAVYGFTEKRISGGDFWLGLWERYSDLQGTLLPPEIIAPFFKQYALNGTVAERMVAKLGRIPSPAQLRTLVHDLSHCLASGSFYE